MSHYQGWNISTDIYTYLIVYLHTMQGCTLRNNRCVSTYHSYCAYLIILYSHNEKLILYKLKPHQFLTRNLLIGVTHTRTIFRYEAIATKNKFKSNKRRDKKDMKKEFYRSKGNSRKHASQCKRNFWLTYLHRYEDHTKNLKEVEHKTRVNYSTGVPCYIP